jgi:hypothetical protein
VLVENLEVEVLRQSSSPVLRMPGRGFPGVVIQGDTLSTFVADARQIVADLRAGTNQSATRGIWPTGWENYSITTRRPSPSRASAFRTTRAVGLVDTPRVVVCRQLCRP